MEINNQWLNNAVSAIENGLADKLEKENVIVYRCGTIIRIDIKGVFKNYK